MDNLMECVTCRRDAIAPKGTWIHVGGTHTDASGMFSIPWKPPSEGLWTIVITFPGSRYTCTCRQHAIPHGVSINMHPISLK